MKIENEEMGFWFPLKIRFLSLWYKIPKFHIQFSISRKLDVDDRWIKWQISKKKTGLDERCTWSLYTNIAKYTLPRLKLLRKITCGYPCVFKTQQEWLDVLDDMIFTIEKIANDETLEKEDEERYDRGWECFQKHFFNLWW